MTLLVQKYGGTSLATPEHLRFVAAHIGGMRAAGNQIAVVVSAMGSETDRLLSLAREVHEDPPSRELDALLSTGEQRSAALLCMSLQRHGVRARSYNGAQLPVQTDGMYNRARIENIETGKLHQCLEDGEVAVLTGYQGVDRRGDINTMGRGGSDTSAVALAAALRADECQIYTDVDGVYTADPRIVKKASPLAHISFEEMLEMAGQGAKVLQTRSVEMARHYRVRLRVLSSRNPTGPGTLVSDEANDKMEQTSVSGISHDADEARLSVLGLPDRPGVAAGVFSTLAGEKINVDVIVQSNAEDGTTNISFTVPRDEAGRARRCLEKAVDEIGASHVTSDENVAKVSLVGKGMRSHSGVAAKMFTVLSGEGINIQMISTSEIKISVIIEKPFLERAVRALHTAFNLDRAD